MTEGRSKSDPLGETCRSYVKEVAYNDFYGIKVELTTKEIEKGVICEQDAIQLLNDVTFSSYVKNEERKSIGWLTGEADVLSNEVLDVKVPWSWVTFPKITSEATKLMRESGYDWQLQGYMMLYGVDTARVVYCLMTTPEHLLGGYDSRELHDFELMPINHRVTFTEVVHRDKEIEAKIKAKYDLANEYYHEVINELKNK